MRSAQRLTALQESRMKSIIKSFITMVSDQGPCRPVQGACLGLARAWWHAPSPTFTALCGEDGEVFTHGEVVKANLLVVCLCVLLAVVG